MEKSLRVLGGGEEAESGHSHSHSHSHVSEDTSSSEGRSTAVVTSSRDASDLRLRSGGEKAGDSLDHNGSPTVLDTKVSAPSSSSSSPSAKPSKLSAYLNLFGDFVHNM